MKTVKFQHFLIGIALCSLIFTGCKKDDSSDPLTNDQINEVQNSDVQDAMSDKVDQDMDKVVDDLQANNYKPANLKSSAESGTVTITVNHPDSTTFPKIVTIIYSNYQETIGGENIVKNGEIDITVTANPNDLLKITRAFTFKNFSVKTDSTTMTLKGTRTVQRTAYSANLNGLVSLRLSATDQITASLNYALVKTGQTDSLKFTRTVSKIRTSVVYFENVGGTSWSTIKLRNNLAKDTITWTGTVTGVNEKGDTYTKTVDESTPIILIFYEGVPVIASGTLQLVVVGTVSASYTITFKQDLPDRPLKTLVTVTDNANGNTYSFARRFSRKMIKWW